MPYQRTSELPPAVRDHLPEHAQDVFLAAFNNAYDDHRGDPRQEEASFRIAWAAVKRNYEKDGDHWVKR